MTDSPREDEGCLDYGYVGNRHRRLPSPKGRMSLFQLLLDIADD